MSLHPLAGKPAPREILPHLPRLISAYYTHRPDPANPAEQVAFGTSGHRGTSTANTFNEKHILAICEAIVEYRRKKGFTGPLYLGMDTHALSEAAHQTALEVFVGSGLEVFYQKGPNYTPTPVISHAILSYNRGRTTGFADGVVITPSHNPPEDGGFKYNPPEGGPADITTTQTIQDRANEILAGDATDAGRMPYERALRAGNAHAHDFITPYVQDLKNVVDMEAIARAGLMIGVDPMGGAGIYYWEPIAEMYKLDIHVVNRYVDPTFSFMTVDKDGKIRMDCSSPYAMASLIGLKNQFDIAWGNDPDYDRHGIVTRSRGLMNPNHYLAVAIWYLFQNRPGWRKDAAVGKTLVSSAMIDRVTHALGRNLVEVPVGFKYFVPGLLDGTYGFGGEESAGAAFLRRDGTVWVTDKDGIIMDLLAAEITAVTGRDPGEHYNELEAKFGSPIYSRKDAPANAEQKKALKNLTPDKVRATTLAGDPIIARLTHAPGNGEAIGGLKIVTESGWFAARPSGTENLYKIYAESFKGEAHLIEIQEEAEKIVVDAFN